MKQLKQRLVLFSWLLVTLSISTFVWASHDHINLDSRLPLWGDSGNKTIDFTETEIVFTYGKTVRGTAADSTLKVNSTSTSVFALNSVEDGYDNTVFNGVLVIDLMINSRGQIQAGGTFAVYSTDALFGTEHTTDFNCNKSGKNCSTGQLVYGGELTGFGWQEHIPGLIEFSMINVSGWAKDNWNAMSGTQEHVLFNVDCSTQPISIPGVCMDIYSGSKAKTFNATASGFAVVPDSPTIVAAQ